MKETSGNLGRRLVLNMTLPREKIIKIYPGEDNLMFEDEGDKGCILVGSLPNSYYKGEVQVGLRVEAFELNNGDKLVRPSFSEVRNLLTRFKRITRILTLVNPDEPFSERSIKGQFLNQTDEKFPLEHWLDDLTEWFKYYDRDRSNALSRQEVADGLFDTFEVMPEKQESIQKFVDSQWYLFDPDDSKAIDIEEFCSESGLGEVLQGQFYVEMGPPPVQPPPPLVEDDDEEEISADPLEYWYNNLSEWFKFYDKDNSNALSKQEVIDALNETFADSTDNPNDISATVESVWGMFDLDHDGTIDEKEFSAYGGFGESLQAQLQAEMANKEEQGVVDDSEDNENDYTALPGIDEADSESNKNAITPVPKPTKEYEIWPVTDYSKFALYY